MLSKSEFKNKNKCDERRKKSQVIHRFHLKIWKYYDQHNNSLKTTISIVIDITMN